MILEFELTDAGAQQVCLALLDRIAVLRKRQERFPNEAERLEGITLELKQAYVRVTQAARISR